MLKHLRFAHDEVQIPSETFVVREDSETGLSTFPGAAGMSNWAS